jgi:signal transduction histidine kinase
MTQPPLDVLTRRSYPELAGAVRARSAQILERWVTAVRQALPTADELTFAQVRDNLPTLLNELADALALTETTPAESIAATSNEHGGTRFHQKYHLDEVLVEYSLLRRILVEQATAHLRRDLTVDESLALQLGIDAAVRGSVMAFAEHQQRQLAAATEAQSKYLSFLSHDLRGGLNGIFLMIEVLRRELSGQPQLAEILQDLDSMRRSILETVGTMDRFLHAEKFRKGKVQVKPGPVNLSSLLGEIGSQFSYQAKDKGVELKVEAPPTGMQVTSDRELLSLVLQNLVSNAVKYTPGKGAVRVAAGPGGAGTGWRVEVADQGPGIPPDRLSELFDSFTRGPTHGQPGVGLGLAIAQQAAQLLGARLWVDSQPGQGSTFYIDLPEAGPPPMPTAASAPARSAPTPH